MRSIDLRYGRTVIPFQYDPEQYGVIAPSADELPLSDEELGRKLDSPIGTPPLEDLISAEGSVLLVVPDATRRAASGQIVNLLVRRLIANGISPANLRTIFATGIHRSVTPRERDEILTPFIARRIASLDHDPYDLLRNVRMGETSGGIPVILDRALFEYDHVILFGGVTFHYFAGFTGGRKAICPGLAGAETIALTHKLAFDCSRLDRREGVGVGLLEGNPVHEAFVEAAAKAPTTFAVNTIVNSRGDAVDLFCGDLTGSFDAACRGFAAGHTVTIDEKRELVIASCGGSPMDINMIQAHKTLEAASHACVDGGTIILLAECPGGAGRDDLLKWFDEPSPEALARRLCADYEVNGQTAWSLMSKTRRFDVRIISSLSADVSEKFGMTPMQSLARAIAKVKDAPSGYIIPNGASVKIISA